MMIPKFKFARMPLDNKLLNFLHEDLHATSHLGLSDLLKSFKVMSSILIGVQIYL